MFNLIIIHRQINTHLVSDSIFYYLILKIIIHAHRYTYIFIYLYINLLVMGRYWYSWGHLDICASSCDNFCWLHIDKSVNVCNIIQIVKMTKCKMSHTVYVINGMEGKLYSAGSTFRLHISTRKLRIRTTPENDPEIEFIWVLRSSGIFVVNFWPGRTRVFRFSPTA